ncbi:hypothetical protein OEB99_04220 [Actinotalea sp. M2MS4P-6]|uniref:hypothetical protein n=1 Tax=Actinotalea sp. M2MS4P-6 TaxID=2983762 RepID=UPI0021E43F7A|nr:hypothetical protein [Actinotalea sp. M2MS4P-6]MCV2393505.1 hypothetical protein [Actinotalea sp. M2MS4P-6]
MINGRPRGSRGLRPVLVAIAVGGVSVGVLASCSTDDGAGGMSPTTGAIAACLTAAEEQLGLEVASGVDVGVEVDEQGWWAVRATTHSGAATQTLTCTAVPDPGPLGARAASFSVDEG